MTATVSDPGKQAAGPRKSNGLLLFLPAPLNRGAFLRWLKRIHGWTGWFGAAAFLFLGVSGILLNHRDQLKIETGAPREISDVMIAVDPAAIRTEADLGAWAQQRFNARLSPRPPKGGEKKGKGEDRFLSEKVQTVQPLRMALTAANTSVTVDYVPGSPAVHAVKTSQDFLGALKALHKGTGMGVAWILVIDAFAGALVAMSLTGLLLWSRLHGPRLAALAILLASLAAATAAAWPQLL